MRAYLFRKSASDLQSPLARWLYAQQLESNWVTIEHDLINMETDLPRLPPASLAPSAPTEVNRIHRAKRW